MIFGGRWQGHFAWAVLGASVVGWRSTKLEDDVKGAAGLEAGCMVLQGRCRGVQEARCMLLVTFLHGGTKHELFLL